MAFTQTVTPIPTIPPHTDISQLLFITNTDCQLQFFSPLSHSRLSLSFAESLYWARQKTSPSTSRISSASQSLNSPSKWRRLPVCPDSRHHDTDEWESWGIYVPATALNNFRVQRAFYLYRPVHCTWWDSETVIWDVLDSRPGSGQVSDQMGLAHWALLPSVTPPPPRPCSFLFHSC